jgi:hypothetical protein
MSIEIGRLEVQSGERDRQAPRVVRCEEGAMCEMRCVMRKCKYAHVSRLARTIILQAVCVRVFADTVGLGGDERGDESARWWVEV